MLVSHKSFFELRTPRDMLEKAERELQRLRADFTIDNLFNFFVTAYHIRDYVQEATTVPQSELDAFLLTKIFRTAGLCATKANIYALPNIRAR